MATNIGFFIHMMLNWYINHVQYTYQGQIQDFLLEWHKEGGAATPRNYKIKDAK